MLKVVFLPYSCSTDNDKIFQLTEKKFNFIGNGLNQHKLDAY